MPTRIIIHALSLVLLNLLAIYCGAAWDGWAHQQHPFAAQIPVGTLIVIIGFPSWYFVINALDAGRWQLPQLRHWRLTYVTALALGGAAFSLLQHFKFDRFSQGRLLTFMLFQVLINVIALWMVIPYRSLETDKLFRVLLLKRWFRRGLRFAGVAFATLAILGCLEVVFFILNRMQPAGPIKVYEGEYLEPGKFTRADEQLGMALLPDSDVHCELSIDDRVIWDVRYSTDKFGRRTTINADSGTATDFAVFFGCSFMFGEGANDDQTIPTQFAAAIPKFRAYNYGVPGYGTQHMLAKLESGTLRDEIFEKQGIAIYLYLEDVHEPRVIGDMQISNRFARNFPYYDFDGHGKLQRYGSFSSGRPVISRTYQLLSKTQFVDYFRVNFPKPNDAHYRLVAKIIEQSRDLMRQQLGCDRFYVAMYPNQSAHRKVSPYLAQAGITVLDYAELFDPNADGLYYTGDGHPTSKANKLLALRLAQDIVDLQRSDPVSPFGS